MPKYSMNGKTYNIPDNLVSKFESENPSATVPYIANGKKYNIPISKRDKFLKSFPDATVEGAPKPYNPSDDTMGAGVGAAVFNAATQPQPTAQQAVQPSANAAGTAAPQRQATQQPYKPTWQEQMAIGMTIGDAKRTANNAIKEYDEREKKLKEYQEKKNQQPVEIGKVGNVVRSDDGTYLTESGNEYQQLSEANAEQQEANTYAAEKKRHMEEAANYEEPDLWDTITKGIGSGLLRTGAGLLDAMVQLQSGTYVRDPSSPTGYSKVKSYEDQLKDENSAASSLSGAYDTADRMSRQAQPKNGKGFLDMLWDGEIGSFLQKGVAVAAESLPMTLSAFNPYTMVLNGISLAGDNYREQTLANPDVPEWKRASMAIGSAAIEQAVEKYADPVFKYVGGSKIFKGAAKETTEQVVNEVTKKATENLAKRIFKRMGGLAKDAAGEGIEEVATNIGNDALGQALDLVSGKQDYGLEAQWDKYRNQNPDATLWDFAQSKAKENVESFIAGGMAGAYTSGTSQLTVKGIEYGLGHMASQQQIADNPNAQLSPVTVDLAQKFDEGYSPSKGEDGVIDTSGDKAIRQAYEAQRQRATEMFGEIKGLDENPMQTLQIMINGVDDGTYTPEQVQAAYDYVRAKASFDGMQQRIVEENRANRHNFVANGNNIDEVDAEGNVVATHEYENADEMRTALWELQAKREHDDVMTDINIAKTNPKYDYDGIIGAFAEETGLDVDYIESILNKDPLELEDPESAMVSEFAEKLHNAIYDNTSVHTDQSAQDGANVADLMGIDLNNLSPVQAQQAQQITADFNAAQQALGQAFARNEDLKQEVERLQNEKMPEQGIVSTLGALGFRPDEVQAVIDYYNTQAKFNGFMLQMNQKINEAAANERQRHIHNGTINGVADVNNVHTITDGVNTYYLVSGDVTTDSEGHITDSASGLIIGMDENGDFVNIGDTNGYSVLPPMQTLDQWEEAERTRLQEAVTAVVDPNQTMMPAADTSGVVEGQSGIQDNAGGEAGGANATGGNEPSATASVSETPQAVQIPVDEKSGLKRYEQGVPVEQAIQDIQNDGFDVGEMTDAYINEAQEQIDKINAKKSKKPQDLIERKRLTDVIDYYNSVKARWEEVNRPEANASGVVANGEENVNVEPSENNIPENVVPLQTGASQGKPASANTVEEQKQQRIADAKAKYGELFDDDFTKANDVYELVSMWIGRNRNLAWDDVNGKRGLQKELGWIRKIGGDTKYIETLLAKKGEGMGVDEFAHMVWESPENSVGEEKRFSTEEIKEALLDLIRSAESKSDIVDRALNTRIAQAEAAMQEQEKQEAEEAEQPQDEIQQMTAEQIAEMEANLPFAQSTDEEIPDAPIVQLEKAIAELQQQEGMPPIKLVDTDRMSDDEWYDIASAMLDGAFVSQEEIETARNYVLEQGVFYDATTGAITVYSDGQTAEEVKHKVETINDYINGRSNEEEAGELETDVVSGTESETPQGEKTETPAAETGNDSEIEGSAESVEATQTGEPSGTLDEYLEPRNGEEEQIIADVLSQLRQEIENAVDERDKARSELQKAMARESERATDMFANDNSLNQPGQLFDNSDMPVDQSMEGVERRTSAERSKVNALQARVDRLQSDAERNSRIRGALDNYRRQTSIDLGGETVERGQSTDPMEAIEQAAQQFREEQEEQKNPKPKSGNKIFTDDAHEEVLRKLRAKFGQLNAGFDPEIALLMLQDAGYHIEKGARKIAECAKAMIEELGDFVRPYIKSAYNAVRDYPGMEEIAKDMSSFDEVQAFDVQNFDKSGGNSVNVNKVENNEAEKDVSLQEESPDEGNQATKPIGALSDEQKEARSTFTGKVWEAFLKAMKTGEKPFKSITDLRKFAHDCGMEVDADGRDDILLQELVEYALVRAAREYLATNYGGSFSKDAYDDIVKLYNLQPTISQRSSNRIAMQQYSTPLPMGFVAQSFLAGKLRGENAMVLEPTAGNGMLVFGIEPESVHANELDKTRLDNLHQQAFAKVTNQDATKPFKGDEQYDAVIANPPFGSAPAKEYDGKEISGLAEQIALNALEKMKDNGKAAIIIGGNMEYGDNGAIKSDKAFFTYLYDHYNVKGVIDMDGKLYQKQGTTYPTRMILIDGRRSEEERAQTKVYPPVKSMAPKKATTFEELFEIAEKIRNYKYKTNGNEVLRTQESGGLLDHNNASGNVRNDGRSGQPHENDGNGRNGRVRENGSGVGSRNNRRNESGRKAQTSGYSGELFGGLGFSEVSEHPSSTNRTEAGSNSGSVSGVVVGQRRETNGEGSPSVHVGDSGRVRHEQSGDNLDGRQRNEGLAQIPQSRKPKFEEKRELDTDKLSYRPHNTAFSLESVAPAAMVEAMDNMLTKIENEHGNIDEWVTKELGYDSVEDMHNALAAEQVDSVAMAIYQMQHGQGMIIGDQTGVGKGRQMAALIRWACRQGKKPVFITKDADLFSDIYRDLVDIGSGELVPFIFNAPTGDKPGVMTDANGNVVFKGLNPQSKKQRRQLETIYESGKLPEGCDYAVLSYSQVNTGDQVSQDEAKETAKKNGKRYQKKKEKEGGKKRKDVKATFLRAIAKDNYMFLDESHNAAGEGNTGAYFQSIMKETKGVTFASATFAKRPDTMPMYALRTAMSKAKVKTEELIKIIEKGGVTLQEIMSRALTQAGQMVRRERDMSDVKTDWKTVDDPETVKKARQNYDSTIEAFNAIIDFQKNWVSPYLDRLSQDLADVAASAGMRQGTEDLGISNVPFASKTYNYTKQLMLALKVDAIVDEVVKEIESGRHPVIALENTMGSLLSEYAPGDVIEDTTFAASLLKGLKGVLRYTVKDEDGNEQHSELSPSQLGPEGEAAYHAVEDLIRESTSGIFISPLDAITEKLQQKGYKVGELTGRNEMAVLSTDGKTAGHYVVQRRTDKDKKKLARDFNSGALDVLILNKSASTGISLHASEKFSDQRQRTMIIAQPLADINDYMQMIGRIDRTGQVHRGYYINLGLPVPAEGRFLMMLSTKLKSLNANTTTSQENESNDVEAPDLLNKYGSQVVVEYLRDNPDVYIKMGEPLKQDRTKVSAVQLDSYTPTEDDARKITGYVALLPTDEQDAFYNDVVRRYTELIQYLNDTGSNDLKISVLPLRARTIERQVSSEGSDSNGENPFARDAYVEWVEMDVLKKPMKAGEVGKVIEQLNPEPDTNVPGVVAKTRSQEKMLNQRMTPRVRQIYDTVENEYQAKMDKEEARYAEAKAKAEEAIKEQTEKINNSKRTTEQKKEAIEKYKGDKMQSVEETHNNMVNKIEASRERIEKPLKDFEVGDSYLVPDDLTTETFMGASPAIFCGFKCKDEGITPSTTLAVFCTLDGRRKIEIKLSDWGPLARIKNHTEQNWDAAHEVTLSNWDSQIPNESRKQGFIMTGNILQAFADAGEDGRVPGQLVTYTDIDGNVHDGILMGQHWSPSQLKGSTVPIKNSMDEIKKLSNGEHITSADGNVVIERLYRIYTLGVPKSKKTGGQYYEDRRLLNLVNGHDFYPNRGQLRADIDPENIEEVVDVLSDLGVQMKSDNRVQFDTESEMGQAMASGRRFHVEEEEVSADVMETIMRMAEEWEKARDERNNNASNPLSKEKGNNGKGKDLHQQRELREAKRRREGRLEDTEGSRMLSPGTRRVIDTIARQLGLKITISNRKFPERTDAFWGKDGKSVELSVELAKKGDQALMKVLGHELTHHIKEISKQYPEVWDAYVSMVKENMGEEEFNRRISKRRKDYDEVYDAEGYERLSDEEIIEEVCADFAGSKLFTDKKFVRQMVNEVERKSGDIKAFVEQMLDFVRDLYDRFKALFGSNESESQQAKVALDMAKSIWSDMYQYAAEKELEGQLQDGKLSNKKPGRRYHISENSDPMEAISRAAEGFREGQTNNPMNHSAKAVYDERLNRVETVFTEAYQDAMVSFKTAQNAIAKDKDIPDSQNAYMAENLMHGKNKNEQDLYNNMLRDPLIATINKIMNLTGMNWGDIDRYVYTKSGLERNLEFFVRDWLEQQRQTLPHSYEDLSPEEQDIYDSMAATIETMFEDGDIATEEEKNKKLAQALQKAHQKHIDDVENRWLSLKDRNYLDLKNGDIDYADYLAGLDNFIRENVDGGYNPSEHDYSGFRAMYGDEKGKYNEAAVIEELMETEDRLSAGTTDESLVDELWNQINAATRYGLERYREAGMRSDEQIDKVEQMFHFYVPMRGFKAETGEDIYQYFTGKDRSKSYVGGLLKHAKGRGSEANYPISTIFAMSYKAISDCNQNLVNQKLYRLCQANPNDLVILSDSWAVLNEATGQWEEVAPEILEDAGEDEVREITLAWEDSMRKRASEGTAKKINGKATFDYKPIDKKNQSEHIVDVRINGQPKKMIVTGNPRMAQALNGQLRFERGHNVFSKWNAAIKNFMASLFTSYSPTFALRNMARDWTHFRMMLGVREGNGYASQANKYYRQSLFKMVGLFKKYRYGKLNENNEMERDFKDFMDNGGITGFVMMQKIDDIQKQMEKLYKQQKEGKTIRLNNKLWEYTLGLVEAVNEGIENNARFATYRASRHYAGRTKARSAYDAKEITVNFNRKGAGGKTAGYKSQNKKVEDAAKAFGVTSQIFGEGRIFFYATVQAIATTFKNFQNADGSLNKPYIAKWAAKYALPPFMFGLLLPAINKALANAFGGDDDDPYANLPEWTRRRNLCFYMGHDNFLTIPIGQELAAFLALGDIVAGNTYAPDLKPVDRNIGDEMVDVMNTFSPVDVSTKITKGGLMEDPISEVTGRTFSVLAPLVAVEQNLGWTGRPIYREDKFQNDQYTPEYQMVYQSANPVLVNASKLLHEIGGGDDIVRGKLEVNPAIIQYLWEQYTGGPGKVFSNTISIGKDAKDILTGNESDFNIRKVEGLKAFISQGDDRTQYYRTQAKYWKYKEDAAELYDAVKGYEAAATTDPTALLKLEELTKGDDFVRMQIVREADNELSKINKAANKADGKEKKELRRLYNELMKYVVDELDQVKDISETESE